MFEQVEQVLKVLKMLTFLGAELLSNWLLNEVSPPDETALARQFFSIPSSEGVRTSQLGPKMTEPTKTEDRRGMKLPQLAFIRRQLAFIYRQIAFFHRQIALIHQPISTYPHLRHREFSRRREAPRTPTEQ